MPIYTYNGALIFTRDKLDTGPRKSCPLLRGDKCTISMGSGSKGFLFSECLQSTVIIAVCV